MTVVGNNAAALETMITALEGLTHEHQGIIEQARTLARAIDGVGGFEAKIHGEYRQVLNKLLEVGRKRDLDAFERVLRELRGEALAAEA